MTKVNMYSDDEFPQIMKQFVDCVLSFDRVGATQALIEFEVCAPCVCVCVVAVVCANVMQSESPFHIHPNNDLAISSGAGGYVCVFGRGRW